MSSRSGVSIVQTEVRTAWISSVLLPVGLIWLSSLASFPGCGAVPEATSRQDEPVRVAVEPLQPEHVASILAMLTGSSAPEQRLGSGLAPAAQTSSGLEVALTEPSARKPESAGQTGPMTTVAPTDSTRSARLPAGSALAVAPSGPGQRSAASETGGEGASAGREERRQALAGQGEGLAVERGVTSQPSAPPAGASQAESGRLGLGAKAAGDPGVSVSMASRPAGEGRTEVGTAGACQLPLAPATLLTLKGTPSSDSSWLEAQRCLALHYVRAREETLLRTLLEEALQHPQAAHDPWLLAERGALELRTGGDALPWANEAERYQHRVGGEAGRQLALKIAEMQARAYRRRFDAQGAAESGGRSRDVALLEREADCWRRVRSLVAGSSAMEQRVQERLKEVEALKAGLSTAGGGQ